ncbi:MAG TPA: succinate dehydrogenase cytochrome b subunit [Thermoanaerobaculia bacterium]|nr:succinate dehydrogenase cytochrome b subunit [Thermoanaerobaculia bacterium]
MSWILDFHRSSLGKKYEMAITGIILFGWIFLHMVGNLKLYLGAEAMNHYGEWLRVIGAPAFPEGAALWISRIVLLVGVWLHIQAAVQLTLMNRRARPVRYERHDFVETDYAARTMRWGGVIILLFVVYHLLHLTTGHAHRDFIPGDPYHNVVVGFQNVWVSLAYVVANLALGLHLYHGLWSMFQSMGWNHPKFNRWRRGFATTFAVVITVGNVSFPAAVMLGLVR